MNVLERFIAFGFSSVEPSIRPHLQNNTRESFKLAAEVERLAQLSSKYKLVSEYKKRLRVASQLADSIIIYLPSNVIPQTTAVRHDLFITAIPDLQAALVPQAIFGWKSRMESFLREHPFDKSVFIMIRYRNRNNSLIKSIKKSLESEGLFGVVASEHSLTDDLYNPIACLLCCSRGIALFDRAEKNQEFNPNVAYELGMLHLLGRRCLIMKHKSLRALQTDILMKLYEPFSGPASVTTIATKWIHKLLE